MVVLAVLVFMPHREDREVGVDIDRPVVERLQLPEERLELQTGKRVRKDDQHPLSTAHSQLTE